MHTDGGHRRGVPDMKKTTNWAEMPYLISVIAGGREGFSEWCYPAPPLSSAPLLPTQAQHPPTQPQLSYTPGIVGMYMPRILRHQIAGTAS